MIIRTTEIKKLDQCYQQAGNQMIVLYGNDCVEKERILQLFCREKPFFYYRARQLSDLEQRNQMGKQIASHYDVKILKNTYQEFFTRIRSGSAQKLVLIIDEFQFMAKKNPDFLDALLKLKAKRLYPGPVLILLCSSSLVWSNQGMKDFFGDELKRVNEIIRLENLKFLDLVKAFPDASVPECVQIYGILGDSAAYVNRWPAKQSLKTNICRQILSPHGFLFHEAERIIHGELRELSVYNTILCSIAAGNRKLNDLYHDTGFSRAKISVYLKNLMEFEVIEKVLSFETGGWENAQKGVYQIRNHFLNFWFHFVFPHMSELYLLPVEEFYDRFIEPELQTYLNPYFVDVCMEYLELLNMVDKLPLKLTRTGTWVGKQGTIDLVAQDEARNMLVGLCNWWRPAFTSDMLRQLEKNLKKAKIKAGYIYLFSATTFETELLESVKNESRIICVDMNQL